MLLRRGQVVAEGWWAPYGPQYPHDLFSLSKSFTSTAVGLAVAEGRLSVDDPVLSFFPGDAPTGVSDHLAAMRVRHLLTMTTGHAVEPTGRAAQRSDGHWVRGFLEHPVEHAPGTHFVYNSSASYVLSAIVTQVTGMTALDYLTPRLFALLGIEKPGWTTCPRGISAGGWGLSIRTEDIARFGQLYLQKGVWRGQQVLPAAWVEEATTCQVPNGPHENPDWAQGYGYQFWRCRHGAYRGDGAFGQFCLVMPGQEAVLAITAGVPDMQAVLNLVWQHLLPAMQPAPLPADGAAQQELTRALADLALPLPGGERSSSLAADVSGKRYLLEPNDQGVESIAFDFGTEGCTISIDDRHGQHRVSCGSGVWLNGTTAFGQGVSRRVAAAGAWLAEDTYLARLCFYETPFCPTMSCRFARDRLELDYRPNVSFGPLELPQLVGRVA
jgi:CubicO group peptidase (beta-lactamase class C family)